ncbi:MAG: glycosyltransferase 87 family protein [Gaiellales bacterium]
MTTRWSRPATGGELARLTVAAIAVLVLSSLVVWHAFPGDRKTTTEANVYYDFAHPVAGGAVPYRDVTIEYPPGAIPVFLLPVWLRGSTDGARWDDAAQNDAARRYESALTMLLVAILAATLVVVGLALARLEASVAAAVQGLAPLAVSPLLLGALPLTRYDAWPALLTSLGLLAALSARTRTSGVALGLAASAKLYPLVLLPGLGVRAWRAGGARRVVELLASCAAAGAAVVVPFLLFAPGETAHAIRLQLARGLQMESLGGSLLAAAWKLSLSLDAHGVLPGSLPVEACQRCDGIVAAELTGTLAGLVGLASLAAVLAALWLVGRRVAAAPVDAATAVWAAAVSVSAVVVLGKVLSAQFLLWLLPLVPLVAGRRGRNATGLLVAAALMTNVWFPSLYRDYVNVLAPGPIAFLLVRNALLVAMLWVLLRPEPAEGVGVPALRKHVGPSRTDA